MHIPTITLGFISFVSVSAVLSTPSHAVILAGTAAIGTDPNTAPLGFANVGLRGDPNQAAGNATAVYLGDSYVLTAAHVGAGATFLNGVLYQSVAGTTVQLHNSDMSLADLIVFKINGTPNIAPVTIAASTPASGTQVDMIGIGTDRASNTISSVTTDSGTRQGYLWGSTQTKRYGTNTTQDFIDYNQAGNPNFGPLINISDGNGGPKTATFVTDFSSGVASDAQATAGDSGGGVFNGSTHELTGIILGIYPYNGQRGDSSVFGEYTFSANLATYRQQIVGAVPEPGNLMSLGVVILSLLKRQRWSYLGASQRLVN